MMAGKELFCGAASDVRAGSERAETMAGAITVFGIAVGGTPLICCVLMARLQSRRRAVSASSRDGCGVDVGRGNDAGDGGSRFHATNSDNSAPDNSGNPSDSGDGGGGGDGSAGSD
jgi:hypothetical protein